MRSFVIAAAALVLVAGPAAAGVGLNGTRVNGLASNGTRINGLGANGTHVNGITRNSAEINRECDPSAASAKCSSTPGQGFRDDSIGSVELIGVELPR